MIKRILKSIGSGTLAFLAQTVVRRYRPYIVMVTGSVGKTSTKDAVAAVLASRFFVRKSEKSFNSEFGVPFTILGAENPWNNPFAWLIVIKKALALLLLPNHYPKMLVLEVGSGKPGDLAQILRIVSPDMVVVTRLPEIPVHVEAYSSPDAVREEEFSPAHAVPASAPLIVPTDDPYAIENAVRTEARVVSYGTSTDATVSISKQRFFESNGAVIGMQSDVTVGSERGTMIVKGSVGYTQLLAAAAAVASGLALGIPFPKTLSALAAYDPPAGRGRLLSGRNGSIIIDDSYNASPAAVEQALETLKMFPHAKRRIAVLGDMLELGRYSVMEHERIAALARESADVVIAVGVRSRVCLATAKHGEVLCFDNSHEAGKALVDMVHSGDIVLIKGSQSIRTERIVEALIADPADVSRLVRQERAWKKRA